MITFSDLPFHTDQRMDNILPTGASPQETCALIEEKICSYYEAIVALKRHRNQYAPISRLPAELLCEIFDVVKREYDSMVCVKFSHVCHGWRELTLESPVLWTKIFPTYRQRWVEEMLERSKTSDLIVESESGDRWSRRNVQSQSWDMIVRQASRIKTMVLKISVENWIELRSLALTVPRLESLSFHSNTFWPGSPLLISDDFINGTDMLRRLDLTGNLHIYWGSRLLHSPLTHLVLAVERYTRTSIAHILETFAHLAPTLQFLKIANSYPEYENPTQIPQNMVHLSCLQSLKLNLHNRHIISLFRCVTFPATSTVIIQSSTTTYDHDPTSMKDLFSAVAQSHLRPDSLTTLRRLFVFCDGGVLEVELIGVTKKTLPDNSTRLDENFVAFQFLHERDGAGSSTDVIPSLFESQLPLYYINDVDLKMFKVQGDSSILAKNLGTLPNLESLAIGQTCLKSVIEILRLESTSFPSLKSLSIHRACLLSAACQDTQNHPKHSMDCPETSPYFMDSLNECLVHKHKNNAGIERLCLTKCNIGNNCPNILKQLKRLIGTVEWDSCEILSE